MFRPIKLLRIYSKLFQSCLLNNHIGEKLSLRPEEAFSNNQDEAGGTDCKPAVLPESSPSWPPEKPHLWPLLAPLHSSQKLFVPDK